jgi:hypothetical protein
MCDDLNMSAKDATMQIVYSSPSAASRPDLLRRFTPSTYAMELGAMQRTVRVETNDQEMLALALKFFERHQHGRLKAPEFVWRIMVEPEAKLDSTEVQLSAFSDGGLRYVNIGQTSFLAVDLHKREAKAFLDPAFVQADARFRHRPPLDILFCMTAASLGLAALSGGCVGTKGRGVLIFGPPNSGKTTASYLAAQRGMEFHADQVVFLDVRSNSPMAWGDPFPAVFRPEALAYLPELRDCCRGSNYGDCSFYYFDKGPMQAPQTEPVVPVCSLFLDRSGRGEAQLAEVNPEDAAARLRECMLFTEDAKLHPQILAALNALAKQPSYSLEYDTDPKIAADLIVKMVK